MHRATLIYALLLLGASLTPAHAYLDPGTGSMVLQAILGGIAMAGAAISVYWQKVRSFFSKRDTKK